jgi:hypothetical protein
VLRGPSGVWTPSGSGYGSPAGWSRQEAAGALHVLGVAAAEGGHPLLGRRSPGAARQRPGHQHRGGGHDDPRRPTTTHDDLRRPTTTHGGETAGDRPVGRGLDRGRDGHGSSCRGGRHRTALGSTGALGMGRPARRPPHRREVPGRDGVFFPSFPPRPLVVARPRATEGPGAPGDPRRWTVRRSRCDPGFLPAGHGPHLAPCALRRGVPRLRGPRRPCVRRPVVARQTRGGPCPRRPRPR